MGVTPAVCAASPAVEQGVPNQGGTPPPSVGVGSLAPSAVDAASTTSELPTSVDEEQRREALRKLLSESPSHASGTTEESSAIEAFYKQRNFQPLWTTAGKPTAQALEAVQHLKNVAFDGLEPADYPQPALSEFLNAEDAAAADLKLTRSLLAYARHLSSGRVSYTRVSGSILYPATAVWPAQVLSKLATSEDIEATLGSFEPPQQGYKALKAQLAKELSNPTDPKHRAKVSNADLLIANMERWRWLPRDLGASYVIVNIPQYTLQLMDKGKPVWATKVVVGKPGDMATPLLSETMKYLTINPTWNVPPSIIRNEYLPALERDPGALERVGLKIGRNHDGSVRVYQPPGPKNALGRIRFNFPNPFLVYQHDTPNKQLFAQERRALSHGCMRVQNPDKYAEALLSVSQPNEKITADRIRELYGDDERTLPLKNPIPVHITYQTAVVDDAGVLTRREDIYELDAPILRLMRGAARAVADKAIPRNYESSSTPVNARIPTPERTQRTANQDRRRNNEQSMPTAFFDRAVGVW